MKLHPGCWIIACIITAVVFLFITFFETITKHQQTLPYATDVSAHVEDDNVDHIDLKHDSTLVVIADITNINNTQKQSIKTANINNMHITPAPQKHVHKQHVQSQSDHDIKKTQETNSNVDHNTVIKPSKHIETIDTIANKFVNDYHSSFLIPKNFSPNAIFSKKTSIDIDKNFQLYSLNDTYMKKYYPNVAPPVDETIVNYSAWINKFPFNFHKPINYAIKIKFPKPDLWKLNKTKYHNNILPWQNNIDTLIKWPFPFFIFQFGDPRTGTSSLKNFFVSNGLPAIHNSFPEISNHYYRSKLSSLRDQSKTIINHGLKKRVFNDFESKFIYFGEFGPFEYINDLNNVNTLFRFEIILSQYPNSKYIWNFRSIKDRLRSKFFWIYGKNNNEYLTNNEWINIFEIVIKDWYKGQCAFYKLIKKLKLIEKKQLVTYELGVDDIGKIVSFFKPWIVLKIGKYHKANSGTKKRFGEKSYQKSLKQWTSLLSEYPVLLKNKSNKMTELDRIIDICVNDHVYRWDD